MTRQQQLKNEARKAEQRSDWARAIELYKDALDAGEGRGTSSEAGIYNRIGDLYLRRGESASAVENYREAADRYADHGLHTSAIALCNKILRIAPDEDDVHGRLARLHASTGLLAEARSAFLQFADRMRAHDRLSEALEAVQDLVGLTGDEGLRTAFAEQLASAGLAAQAVAQLRLVYEERVAGGRNAQDIRQRILELDPDADPVAGPAAPPPHARTTVAPESPRTTTEPADAPVEELLGVQSVLGEDTTTQAGTGSDSAVPTGPSSQPDGAAYASEDMESVLTRFRSQVLEIVEDTDYAVHYDLGVAYMGMGLLDEAIGELQLAIQSPAQMEAANALLGECLRLRADREEPSAVSAGPAEDAPSLGIASELEADHPEGHFDVELPLEAADAIGAGAGIDLDEATALTFPAGDLAPIELTPPGSGEGTAKSAFSESDDLANMLFQARLAQHRVRQASDDGRVDHAAHLELGGTYQAMGLHGEAVDDLVTASAGPRGVADDALSALENLANDETIDAVPLQAALKCLIASGRSEAAEAAAQTFLARSGLSSADRAAVLEALPGDTPTTPAHESTEVSAPSAEESMDELEGIMAELDAAADDEPERSPEAPIPTFDAGPATLFGEAEGLREAGRLDEAAAHYYRALELYEKGRDARSAIRVIDRLLGLRPDDVVLHHQKTEFAIMTNDRDLLISAYLDLAACLRRQNGLRSARTVFGRILDLDPGNAEARAGIAAIDADELARERQRKAATERVSPTEPVAPEIATIPSESQDVGPATADFDQMLDELRRPGAEQDPDYESHYELGIAFRQMQMWDEAAREFKLAVQGMREPLPAYEMLGEALINLRRYEEARRTLSTAITQPGDDASAKAGILFHLGVAHMRAGDADEARRCLERVVVLDASRTDAAQLLSALSR